jgi:hypothetical protein
MDRDDHRSMEEDRRGVAQEVRRVNLVAFHHRRQEQLLPDNGVPTGHRADREVGRQRSALPKRAICIEHEPAVAA